MQQIHFVSLFSILVCGALNACIQNISNDLSWDSGGPVAGKVLFNDAQNLAADCAENELETVSLYKIEDAGQQLLTTTALNSDGTYKFNSNDVKNVNLRGNDRYLLVAELCGDVQQERILTGRSDQSISVGSTVLAISARLDNSYSTASLKTLNNLNNGLETSDVSKLISIVTGNDSIDQLLANIGTNKDKFLNSPPVIKSVKVPSSWDEGVTQALSVKFFTWNPNYTPGVVWKLNGITISNESSFNHMPLSTPLDEVEITLYVGKKSAEGIDTSYPFFVKTIPVFVKEKTQISLALTSPSLSQTCEINVPGSYTKSRNVSGLSFSGNVGIGALVTSATANGISATLSGLPNSAVYSATWQGSGIDENNASVSSSTSIPFTLNNFTPPLKSSYESGKQAVFDLAGNCTNCAGTPGQIASTDDSVCAIDDGGGVVCWGDNPVGNLGNGTTTSSNRPVRVTGLASGVTAISGGGNVTTEAYCAILDNKQVKCWGSNVYGQLGDATNTPTLVPVDVCADSTCSAYLTDIKSVSVGREHACAIKTDGSLYCWGRGANYKTGQGNQSDYYYARVVGGMSNIVSVASSTADTCAVNSSGALYCWGYDGTVTRTTPTLVAGLATGVKAVYTTGNVNGANPSPRCALLSDGAAKCWGNDSAVWLTGVGPNEPNMNPTPAFVLKDGTDPLTDIVSIAMSRYNACYLTSDAKVYCSGYSRYGALGATLTNDNSVVCFADRCAQRPTIIDLMPVGIKFVTLAATATTICGLTDSKTVKCWGHIYSPNRMGQGGSVVQFADVLPITGSGTLTPRLQQCKLYSLQ